MPPEPPAGDPEADVPDEAPDRASGAPIDPSDEATHPRDRAPDAGDEPADEPGPDLEGRARCPYCGSRDVVRFSRFGSEVSSQQYECKACGSPFERLRYDGELPDTRRDED